MVEACIYELKKNKNAGNGEGTGERTSVPYYDLPFSLTLKIFLTRRSGNART